MPGHRPQDLIVYETHPKGFTASPASGVAHPGTFRGIGENVAYFKDLGINAVELMPSMFKSTDGGYWGYDTIGFFIPELTYTVGDPNNPAAAIDEFKEMVDTLHQNGIEVFMDVVFNHTGEGGLWQSEIQQDDVPPLPDGDPTLLNFDPKEVASILSFRGFDNASLVRALGGRPDLLGQLRRRPGHAREPRGDEPADHRLAALLGAADARRRVPLRRGRRARRARLAGQLQRLLRQQLVLRRSSTIRSCSRRTRASPPSRGRAAATTTASSPRRRPRRVPAGASGTARSATSGGR